MNTQEAKFILQAYRPGGEDAGDPQFAEALALAKLDPELAKWFAEQLAFDAVATRALNEVKAPRHLRDSILAGRRVIEPAFWWKQPAWLAMAAAIVVILGLVGFWFNRKDSTQFANYRSEMVQAADTKVDHVEFPANNPAQIEAWLADHNMDTNYIVPAGLRGVIGMGCRVVSWNGHKISMICFPQQETNHVDFFVAARSDFKAAAPGVKPQFVTIGTNVTASWSQHDKVYLLVGHGLVDETLLKNYIEQQSAAYRIDREDMASAQSQEWP